VIPTVLK